MTKIGGYYQQGEDIYRVIETSERPFLRLQNVRTDSEVKVYLEDLERESYQQLHPPTEIKLLQEEIKRLTEQKNTPTPPQEAQGG